MRIRHYTSGLLLLALVLPNMPAQAQLMDQLKGAVGSGPGKSTSSSAGSPLGGLGGGLPSVGQASTSNTAGVLQYCVKNNYLSGGSASSIKDSLVNKVGGSSRSENDSGYKAGSSGLLQTGNGQNYSLGGSDGIKQQATHKVCDLVLQHAKSLL